MSFEWYVFLCGLSSDMSFKIDQKHINFHQNKHQCWLSKENISFCFTVLCPVHIKVKTKLSKTVLCDNIHSHNQCWEHRFVKWIFPFCEKHVCKLETLGQPMEGFKFTFWHRMSKCFIMSTNLKLEMLLSRLVRKTAKSSEEAFFFFFVLCFVLFCFCFLFFVFCFLFLFCFVLFFVLFVLPFFPLKQVNAYWNDRLLTSQWTVIVITNSSIQKLNLLNYSSVYLYNDGILITCLPCTSSAFKVFQDASLLFYRIYLRN